MTPIRYPRLFPKTAAAKDRSNTTDEIETTPGSGEGGSHQEGLPGSHQAKAFHQDSQKNRRVTVTVQEGLDAGDGMFEIFKKAIVGFRFWFPKFKMGFIIR